MKTHILHLSAVQQGSELSGGEEQDAPAGVDVVASDADATNVVGVEDV